MSDFNVEIIGDKPGDIEKRLTRLGARGEASTNRALLESAQEIQKSLEQTSPVDTGEYQSSWYIFEVAEDEVWILNEASHAKFVILPNQVMVNSGKADLPASGILHDVKGVARENKKGLFSELSDKLKQMIQQFAVK